MKSRQEVLRQMKWVPSKFQYFETSWIQKCVVTFGVCNWVARGVAATLLSHVTWLQIAFLDSSIPRLDIPPLTSVYQWPKIGSKTGNSIEIKSHLDKIFLKFFIGQFWILVMNNQYHIEYSKIVKLHKFLSFAFYFGQKFSRLCQSLWWCLNMKWVADSKLSVNRSFGESKFSITYQSFDIGMSCSDPVGYTKCCIRIRNPGWSFWISSTLPPHWLIAIRTIDFSNLFETSFWKLESKISIGWAL